MELGNLTKSVINLMGTGLLGTIAIIIVLINKNIIKWVLKNIWTHITYRYTHKKISKREIETATKIREVLIELRTLVNADRTCLFQFHNGSVFTTKNPIWKFSNTHESVVSGISSEIGKLQDIKASSMIETLQVFWSDICSSGIEIISPEYCGECPDKTHTTGKKIIYINVNNLEDSYSRSLLIEQGIKHIIEVPILNRGNYVGFVSANYCSDVNIEEIKKTAYIVCRNASQIQFLLLK